MMKYQIYYLVIMQCFKSIRDFTSAGCVIIRPKKEHHDNGSYDNDDNNALIHVDIT